MNNRNSPMDLRDGLERDELDTYQPPRLLTRQTSIDEHDNASARNTNKQQSSDPKDSKVQKTWLARLSSSAKTPSELKRKLSQRIARLSSLDSTRSSSSMELDNVMDQQARQQQQHKVMPLISITSNDTQATSLTETTTTTPTIQVTESERRQNEYRDYYGRPRYNMDNSEQQQQEEDDDDDAFVDSPLPMPYSSSSRSIVAQQQNDIGGYSSASSMFPLAGSSYTSRYEELLDDRQGMNSGNEQFTKAEQANRPSLDGSIISELRLDGRKPQSSGGGGGRGGSSKSNKDKGGQRQRSKSPSSSSATREVGGNRRASSHRQSRRGFLGLASRLKLTKKHESIAKLQLSILNSGFVSLKTLDRDLQSFLPKERMTIKQFEERVRLMRKYEVLSTIEYRFASKYETYVCKHAQQETNLAKNNYKKCIPYDYNRVVLKTLPNVPDSDYINASHVDSCLKPNAYIAAQGPNEFTIDDFWRMIWEQKTFVIVMLTKVFDFIRVMCNQYWPVEVNKPERYGNLEVTLLYEEPLADFVIRTIRLTKLKGGNNQQTSATDGGGGDHSGNNNPETDKNKQVNDKIETADRSGANNALPVRRYSGDELYEDDDYNYTEDDTSESEELIMTTGESDIGAAGGRNEGGSNQNLTVRAPRFVGAHKTGGGRRRDRAERASSVQPGPPSRAHHQRASSPALSEGTPSIANRKQQQQPQRPNEFLHPLFNASTAHLGASSASLHTASSEPQTPMTPRTPSSAGLDRSSATRRAVKKKRRIRVKNQRPRRTQFMVPTESQLLDDDDDEDQDGDDQDQEDANEEREREAKETTKTNNERIIYQFHYMSWASHTCPFISSLLHFRRRVRICMDEMAKSGKTGPTVVHCNDGCGRTGAYLCIDSNLELAEEDNVIDIFNYTKKMRQSRKFLIENLEQYKFVYDTIEEAMFCGKTWFPVSELHKRLKHKSQRNPLTKKNEYQREYEKICQLTSKFSIGDCAGGHRVENREKNRDVSTVPPDNFRPYLTSFQTNDSTDYINAVFVDGYTRSKEYIVTEWPLHKTISDFWSLIYDHDCNSVILLANPGESSTYPSFLPSEKELRRKFGPVFSAEMVSYTHYQNIKSWIYTINKKIVSLTEVIAGVKSEAKTTQVFQITCWPQGHRVPTSTNALVELMNMVERWRQRTTYGPVCVVSLNGKSRAGVYCAANVAIEQVVQHSEVDVFQAVKTVRRHRPQLIENMTEYKYCYDLILHYVLHYVNNQSATSS